MVYLVPVPIAENAITTLPEATLQVVKTLDIFVVERGKTARHWLKEMKLLRPLQEMIFIEMEPERESMEAFRQQLLLGKSVGIVSEAGCPGVADPGARYVQLAHELGKTVIPLVGPSSILLALMASGMSGQQFCFHGYLSPKRLELASDLRRLEQQSEKANQTQLFIETPYRNAMVIEVALATLRSDTYFGVAYNLTGDDAFNYSGMIAMWKKKPALSLEKKPAVFSLMRMNQ